MSFQTGRVVVSTNGYATVDGQALWRIRLPGPPVQEIYLPLGQPADALCRLAMQIPRTVLETTEPFANFDPQTLAEAILFQGNRRRILVFDVNNATVLIDQIKAASSFPRI